MLAFASDLKKYTNHCRTSSYGYRELSTDAGVRHVCIPLERNMSCTNLAYLYVKSKQMNKDVHTNRTYIHQYIYACTCIYIYTYTYIYIYARTCTYIHAECMHACMHACMHIRMHMHIHVHIHIPYHTHPHMHIHIHIRNTDTHT